MAPDSITSTRSAPIPPLSRVSFPLWAKMSLTFGGLIGALVLAWGALDLTADLREERARRQDKLQGLAQTVAASIDGQLHASFTRSTDTERPEHAALVSILRTARHANDLGWIGTSARDDRGRHFLVIDGGSPPPLPVGYPIFDGLSLRDAVYADALSFAPDLEDEWGRWTVAMAPIHDDNGAVVGVVEVMEDAAWRSLYARTEALKMLALALLVIGLSSAVAVLFSRRLGEPLRRLTRAARAVARGDLQRDVRLEGSDEIRALAEAFNAMIAGLREREFIRETFGRFVSHEVATRALTADAGQTLGGESRVVSILFSDLRGFSALSRRLGPAQMVSLLNRYLSKMTDTILDHHGNLSEMLGDGLVVLFGAPVSRPDDALRAVQCAVDMQRALEALNRSEGLSLEMGIGISTGEVIAGNIGSEKRMKYGVVGPPINLAARLESFTVGGQTLICDATQRAIGDSVALGEALSLRAKGWPEPLRCYPVRGVGDRHMPEATIIFSWRPADFPAVCWRIEGKQVSDEPLPAQVLGVGEKAVMIATTWKVELWEKLRVTLGDGDSAIEEVYASVVEVGEEAGWWATLRISSMPEQGAARLEALRATP